MKKNFANGSPILIDDRIGSKELAEYITSPKRITRLHSADFALLGNGPKETELVSIGIERKTIGDLISSMDSGRLSGHQLLKLRKDYQCIYLLVEGLWRPRAEDGVLEVWSGKWKPYRSSGRSRIRMARDISNYLNTLSVCSGVHIWRTDSIQHSGRWISDIYRWWHKPWDAHRSHMKQFNVEPPPTAYLRRPDLLHRMIKEIDGLGWDKSKALSRHFGSMINILYATEKEIAKTPGIGKTLAKRTREQLDKLIDEVAPDDV